jgi:hypothetical protein
VVIAVALAALAAALSAPPPERDTGERAYRPQGTAAAGEVVTVDFDAGRHPPRRDTIRAGSHVVVRVQAPRPGEVAFKRLGLLETATPAAPATFDLLLEDPGTYDATFRPADGGSLRVGTLVVEHRRR